LKQTHTVFLLGRESKFWSKTLFLCSYMIQLLFCAKSDQTQQLKIPEQDLGGGWHVHAHIAVEKVENQGMGAVLAEMVYLKIRLQTMGAVD